MTWNEYAPSAAHVTCAPPCGENWSTCEAMGSRTRSREAGGHTRRVMDFGSGIGIPGLQSQTVDHRPDTQRACGRGSVWWRRVAAAATALLRSVVGMLPSLDAGCSGPSEAKRAVGASLLAGFLTARLDPAASSVSADAMEVDSGSEAGDGPVRLTHTA